MTMKVETKIDAKNNLRIHTITGLFDLEELLKVLDSIYDNSEKNLDMEVLWDLRKTEGVSAFETQHLDKLVSMVSQKWEAKEPRRAAIVVSRLVDFGLARMYEMRMENLSKNEIQVFNDFEEAIQWLCK